MNRPEYNRLKTGDTITADLDEGTVVVKVVQVSRSRDGAVKWVDLDDGTGELIRCDAGQIEALHR